MAVLERQAASGYPCAGTLDVSDLIVDEVQAGAGSRQPPKPEVGGRDVCAVVVLQEPLNKDLLSEGVRDAKQAEIGLEGSCVELDVVELPTDLGNEGVANAKAKRR